LDSWLCESGAVESRNKAQRLVAEGKVTVNGIVCGKVSCEVGETDVVEVTEFEKYVGRGGYKLEKAIEHFGIDLTDKICLDVGASTGGFTQCMLLNGAKKVYAVDVGTGQLHETLKKDSRVINLEKTDIRNLSLSENTDSINDQSVEKNDNSHFVLKENIDFCSIDVSFISLTKILPFVKEMDIKNVVSLIKPQFEAGKSNIGKHGIVKSIKIHKNIIENIIDFVGALDYNIKGVVQSPIKGGDGNIEYLMYMVKR
jgi:23S rRNA (cytidine1920-2'-O)/16S rRNA (cytidine1409-2'-O)-methyltransferase